MKITARGIFLSVFFSIVLLLFTGKAFAADTYSEAVLEKEGISATPSNSLNTEADVPQNVHTAVQILIIETLSAVNCQLTGIDPASKDHRCLGMNPETGKIGYLPENGGLVGVVGGLIGMTFNPPISTGQYVAYLDNNFGIQKSTYAAGPPPDAEGPQNNCRESSRGIGFCSLTPVLDIWIAMRNVVYLILILAFVVIGIGIMLRVHIDPRTVMTIQNQVPKIIVGILLISFSFAIAGILIDTMWVATYLFAAVIGGATGQYNTTDVTVEILRSANPFNAFSVVGGGIGNIASQSSMAFTEIVKTAFTNIFDLNGVPLIGFILDGFVKILINSLAFIIIAIAILIALLRLFVTLILAYINIILDVVFAPFWLLAGILPGGGMGTWFKDLLSNLAIFPVAISFILLGNYFVNAFSDVNTQADRLVPPLTSGINDGAVAALIGLGFILMLPGLLVAVKGALKAPKLNFGPIFGPIGAAAKYPTSIGKRTGAIYAGRNEAIMKKNKHGEYEWGEKGIAKGIQSQILH